MNAAGDNMVTTGTATQNPRPRKGSNKGPHATVKFGPASVPIYLSESKGRKRFIIAHYPHYRDGKRLLQTFTYLINEFDRFSRDAQDLLLTMLDRMPSGHATKNLDIGNLTERLPTRFLLVRLQPPEN